jgi:hypothetical protein
MPSLSMIPEAASGVDSEQVMANSEGAGVQACDSKSVRPLSASYVSSIAGLWPVTKYRVWLAVFPNYRVWLAVFPNYRVWPAECTSPPPKSGPTR